MKQRQHGATNLRIKRLACEIAGEVHAAVSRWNQFEKNTLGIQMVRAADSIGNNIAEGYSRITTADRLNFLMYSESSLQELRTQLSAARDRDLIASEECQNLDNRLFQLSIMIIDFCHSLIKRDSSYTGKYIDYINRRRAWRIKPDK